MKRCLILILLLCLITGCAGPGTAAVAASAKERISSPDVAAGDLRELADGNNAFAFDLYRPFATGKKTCFFPLIAFPRRWL